MALEKVYQYQFDDLGTPLTNAATVLDITGNVLWYWKAFLMSQIQMKTQAGATVAIGAATGKWDMDYSCDGLTAGTPGDGVDRLGTTVYPGSAIVPGAGGLFVYATAGTAHSWYVLKRVIGIYTHRILVSWEGSNSYQARISFSRNAFAGGSVTARPTSTNEAVPAQTSIQVGKSSGATAFNKGHGALAADGSFFLNMSQDGSGKFFQMFNWGPLTDIRTNDSQGYHCRMYVEGNDAGASSFGVPNNINYGAGRHFDGSVCGQVAIIAPQHNGSVYSLDVIDATSNNYAEFPMFFRTEGPSSFRGRIQDWKWATATLADGTYDLLAPSIDRYSVGDTTRPARAAPGL